MAKKFKANTKNDYDGTQNIPSANVSNKAFENRRNLDNLQRNRRVDVTHDYTVGSAFASDSEEVGCEVSEQACQKINDINSKFSHAAFEVARMDVPVSIDWSDSS